MGQKTHETTLHKGVLGQGVRVNRIEPDTRHGRGEDARAEDAVEDVAVPAADLQGVERLEGHAEDPEVHDDVEGRGEVEEGSRVDARGGPRGGRQGRVPLPREGLALPKGHRDAHDEEDAQEGVGGVAGHAEGPGQGCLLGGARG